MVLPGVLKDNLGFPSVPKLNLISEEGSVWRGVVLVDGKEKTRRGEDFLVPKL